MLTSSVRSEPGSPKRQIFGVENSTLSYIKTAQFYFSLILLGHRPSPLLLLVLGSSLYAELAYKSGEFLDIE